MDITNFDTNNSITEGTKASVIKILYEINLDLRNRIYSHDDYGAEGYYHLKIENIYDSLTISMVKNYDDYYDDFEQAKNEIKAVVIDHIDDLVEDIFSSSYDRQASLEELEVAMNNFDIDKQINYLSILANSYSLLIKILNPYLYKYHVIKVDFSNENFELFNSYTKLEEMVEDLKGELEKINDKRYKLHTTPILDISKIMITLQTKFINHDKEIELFNSGMIHKLQKWTDIPVTGVVKYMTHYIYLNNFVNNVMFLSGLIILKI